MYVFPRQFMNTFGPPAGDLQLGERPKTEFLKHRAMEDFVERRLRALSGHFDQSLVASRPVSFGMSDDDSGTVSWLIKEGDAADQLAEKVHSKRV